MSPSTSCSRSATKQDRIGRRDCADVAITPGAKLNECDLTGADLDRALVSLREPDERVTRMLLADLTGATMRGADLTGLSVAGGRLNGADLAKADLTNLSLAGAEATGLDARDATSDPKEGTGGGNFFDTNLSRRQLPRRGAERRLVQPLRPRRRRLRRRDLDLGRREHGELPRRRPDATCATRSGDSRVSFADFTGADLRGAALTPVDLDLGVPLSHDDARRQAEALEDRDCRAKEEERPEPAADPAVVGRRRPRPRQGRGDGEGDGHTGTPAKRPGSRSATSAWWRSTARTGLPTPLASQTIDGRLRRPPLMK